MNPDEPDHRIASVYVWANGMVMTFDTSGQQMPEYQGLKSDVLDKVMKALPPGVTVEYDCEWEDGQ